MNQKEKKTYIKNEPVSHVRKNAKKMEKSRDDWKEKNLEKANSIKALKTRVLEAKTSRDSWKLESLQYSKEVKILEEKVQTLEKELIVERIEKEGLQRMVADLKKKLPK